MKHWFITGSSKGLGKSIAELLLRDEQNYVYGLSRDCVINHPHYQHRIIDLSSSDQLVNYKFPQIQSAEKIILINNAATLGQVAYSGEIAAENILTAHTLNIIAPHILMNAFISTYGSLNAQKIIVNITSGAASSPYDGWSIYGSGKAALDMLTRISEMEMQLRGKDIEVYAIAPGILDTNMQAQIRSVDEHDFSRKKKFEEFKDTEKLVSPEHAAMQLIELILHTEKIPSVISRL